MFCTNCGQQNPDSAHFCTSCGQEFRTLGEPLQGTGGQGEHPLTAPEFRLPHSDPVPSQPQSREEIPNYLVQAIAVTICCCIPAGIVSIVYAAQVNGKVASGDIEGARRSSNNARTWAWVALGLGILGGIFSAVISF